MPVDLMLDDIFAMFSELQKEDKTNHGAVLEENMVNPEMSRILIRSEVQCP